jgi:hypothetical protein
MAAKKQKPKSTPAPELPRASVRSKLDPRILIYGILDVVLAGSYVYAILVAAPSRHAWAQMLLLTVPLFAFVMGVGTLVGGFLRAQPTGRLGWFAAVASGFGLLLFTVVVLGLLLASAAFLSGVYGAFGKAAAGGVLGAAALIIEVVAIIPVLQLKFLFTRAGRRAFGQPPIWGASA